MDEPQKREWEIKDHLRAIRRNWLIILLCSVLGLGVAATLALISPPRFEANTSLYVSVRSPDNEGVSDLTQGGSYARQSVRSYIDILDDAIVLEPVINELQLEMTPSELAPMISAWSPSDTVLIQISVASQDPEQAATIANSVATNFVDVVVNILEKPTGNQPSPVQISVTQEAVAPDGPISPSLPRYLTLGLLIGILVGLGIALLRNSLDTRLTGHRDLAQITDLPVLGAILDDPKASKNRLVVHSNPRSPRSESFRSLRTNLQFVNINSNPRSFVVTSSVPGEGKTTVSANLAVSLAQAGSSVLLIDADMRKPAVAKVMGVDGVLGLSNLLVGMVELEDVIHRWGNIELFVLPAGRIPPNPSELLSSQEMSELVDRLIAHFDYVIVDSPPVLAVTDATIISRLVGGTLLVTAVGAVRIADISASLSALRGIAKRLSGIVLTHVPTKGPDSYSYARYEYHETVVGDAHGSRLSDNPLGWLEGDTATRLPSRHTKRPDQKS